MAQEQRLRPGLAALNRQNEALESVCKAEEVRLTRAKAVLEESRRNVQEAEAALAATPPEVERAAQRLSYAQMQTEAARRMIHPHLEWNIFGLAAYQVAIGLLAFGLGYCLWDGSAATWPYSWLGIDPASPEGQGLQLIGYALCWGILGGVCKGIMGMYQPLRDRTFDPAYTTWYLLRPPLSGLLAMAVYLLVTGGLWMLGTTAALTNRHAVCGLAFLVGFGTRRVVVTLDRLVEVVFVAERREGGERARPPAGPEEG